MTFRVNPTTGELDLIGEDSGGGGGTTLAPQYHRTDAASATTTYSGINTNSSTSDSGWTIVRKVLSGNNREILTVSTATDQWDNRATASYTTSLTYSN